MANLEQEINLREYINVIIRRKKVILTIFLVSVAATAIMSLQMPKVYEVSMIIEPSTSGTTSDGKPIYLDTPQNIEAKIKEEAFNSKIRNALKLDPKAADFRFDVSQPQHSDLVKISIEQKEKNKELGMGILNALFAELSDAYKEGIEYKKDMMEKKISTTSDQIIRKRERIKLGESRVESLEEIEKQLLAELKETKNNLEEVTSRRDTLLLGENLTGNMGSLIVFSNSIQHNISYFNSLSNQISNLKSEKKDVADEIKALEIDINNLQMKVHELNLEKANIHNIKLLQEPEVSLFPIGPNRMKYVQLAGTISLMFGVLLAFFMEFWERSAA